jgi:hypothetical protein
MTPEQKIKHLIINRAIENEYIAFTDPVTAENVDDYYNKVCAEDLHWDYKSEIRNGDEETNISTPFSRHFESKSVAAKAPDGSWIGWTYWYGGGKHAEPDAIEWMSEAYDLTMTEEERVITVKTFTQVKHEGADNA